MVPDGWGKRLLSDLADVTSGGTPSRTKPEYWGGDIPWITTAEIGNWIIIDSQERITALGLEESSAKIFPRGTVLLAMYGQGKTRGQVARLGINASTNQACAAILPKENVCGEFLYQNLLGRYEEIRNLSNDGSQKNLSGALVKSIPILQPPIAEQEKIAEILTAWDRAIETIENLIENSQTQKKALMRQLLTGKQRLSGFQGEWAFRRIDQISKRVQRKSDGQDHPVLTISSTSGFVRQDEKYSRYMAGKSVENYILLRKGEFAYNKGNSKTYQFGCVFDLDGYDTGLVPHVYVCFQLNNNLSHRYFKYIFESDYLKPQLGRLVNTGVRNNGLLNIKPSEFLGTKVPVPSLPEQEKISDILEAGALQIEKLQQQLKCLNQEKRALMQQLLTGKRRVKECNKKSLHRERWHERLDK
ncbi:MAG: restriction endonuclease subunit S [Candidatus Thiodiazotropha sp. (ex Troendleina suluensis)]|nr:restriction endonuclease subunit S [Candidatus Thiodiazotropha sp. (ex Troendleina suluensis)]